MASYFLLIVAGFGAGLINSVAGGGSFLTFPALVFNGVPSIIANASSTVALLPGSLASAWAYRSDFKREQPLPFRAAMAVSLAGGVVGALLLLHTSQRTFDSLIPWLMLGATLLFALGPRLSPILRRRFHVGLATVITIQFLIGIYGGYFGGAIGILMLAAWSLVGVSDIHVMNANKTILGAAMNGSAVVLFLIARKVWWAQTIPMLLAAVVGGYVGARTAKHVNPAYVRGTIIIISAAITLLFFLRS